jgi:hypothetical protein
LALGFGVFLAFAEVARNWGDWGYAPFWIVDYIAAALLVYGGWRARPPRTLQGVALLSGAWGFACAMCYASFFSHLEQVGDDGVSGDETRLTAIIGVLFVLTIAGFVASLLGSRAGEP